MELIKLKFIEEKYPKYTEDTYGEVMGKLKKSIQKYGQLKNLVVYRIKKEEYVLIEGSAILQCMKELNYSEAWCKVITNKQEHDVLKLKVLLNDLVFPVDYIKLAEYINDLRDKMPFSEKLTDLPYTKAQIDKFKHIFRFDWADFEMSKKDLVDPDQISIFNILNEENNENESSSNF